VHNPAALLRADKNAEFIRLPFSVPRVFTGRYALKSGNRLFDERWKRRQIDALMTEQGERPVRLSCLGKRVYWMFRDCFYWEDDGLSGGDVKALALQRLRKRERQLTNAHSLMRAEEQGKLVRAPLPADVRRAVFERDGGRCVECESGFDLQYDHIIPFSLGGATTVANLQLLCAGCNARKGNRL
jgi:5-methylcytosine-specific restriction endonuclease McrA